MQIRLGYGLVPERPTTPSKSRHGVLVSYSPKGERKEKAQDPPYLLYQFRTDRGRMRKQARLKRRGIYVQFRLAHQAR